MYKQIEQAIAEGAICFHEDAGHGWLQVPMAMIKEAAIKPSGYSYKDGSYAYLEEDCDAALFTRKFAGIEWQSMQRHYKDNSPIRNKAHF